MPTVLAAAAWPCPTCGDGSGWVRWPRERAWIWAACADCNADALKAKPPLCATCHRTHPFCTCPPRQRRLF